MFLKASVNEHFQLTRSFGTGVPPAPAPPPTPTPAPGPAGSREVAVCCQPSGFCQVTLGGDALNLSVPQRFLPYLTSTEAPGFTPCGHAEWTGDSGSRASEPLCGRDHVTPGRQQDFTAAGACFVQEGEGRGSLKSLEENHCSRWTGRHCVCIRVVMHSDACPRVRAEGCL